MAGTSPRWGKTVALNESRRPSRAWLSWSGAGPEGLRRRGSWLGWFALLAVGAPLWVEAARILVTRPPVVLYGDQALMDLAARRAAHLDQLVGPYSRAGFHHPGPAVFYLLAPFVRLLGSSGSGLYLGAVVINLAALTASVAVVWHRAGPRSALWAALSINAFCLCVGLGTLREPWNPYLIVAPMILFVVLWASAMTGSVGSGIWALVVGSYEIQTHIATAAVVIVMSVALVVSMVAKGLGRGRALRWPVGHWVGLVALGLLWLPPVVELDRDRPNNLQLLWTFFTGPHPSATWAVALRVSADALTIVPFGYHDYVLTVHRTAVELLAAAVLVGLVVTVAIKTGRRRQTPFAHYLLIAAAVGGVIGPLSLTRSGGPVYLYFAVWLSFVPLAVLLAAGAALFAPAEPNRSVLTLSPSPRRSSLPRVGIAAWVVAAGLVGATVASDLGLNPLNRTIGSGPWPLADATSARARHLPPEDTAVLSRAAERVLRPSDLWAGVTIGSASVWPYAAGLVLQLDEEGVQTTVSPASWGLYFGHRRVPGHPVSVSFSLFPVAGLPASVTTRASVLTEVDGVALVYSRTA